MDDSNVWLPHLDILQLAYEKNKSYFHSLNHGLRVWAFSMLISQDHLDLIDRDVLSAAALFHCVKKERDWNDKEDIENTAKWIDEYLPAINPDFDQDQIDLIKVLCTRQESDDHSLETIESKILNDAELLDKHRLLRKKIDKRKFVLEGSSDLIPLSKKFYQTWKKNSSKQQKTPPELLKLTLRETPEFRRYHNLIQTDQLNLKGRAKHQKAFQKLERNMTRLKQSCSQFDLKLTNGSLSINDIEYLEGSLDKILTTKVEDCITCKATHFEANSIVRNCLKKNLPDQTLSGKERKSIRKLYQRCLPTAEDNQLDSKDIASITPLFYSDQYLEAPTVASSLRNYLAYTNQTQLLNLTLVFTQKKHRQNLLKTYSEATLKYSDLDLSIADSELEHEKWLWLNSLNRWLQQINTDPNHNDNYRNSLFVDYLYHLIDKFLHLPSLELPEVTFLLEKISKLNQMLPSTDRKKTLADKLFKNFQSDLLLNDKITMIEGGSINSNLNLFHQYDGDNTLVTEFLSAFERTLISFSQIGYEVDGVIRDFLLPVALNEEFNYSLNEKLLDMIKNRESLNLIGEYNTLRKKHKSANIQELTYLYIKGRSLQNVRQLTNQSKHHALVQTKDDYKVVSKVLNFEIIESILRHNSFLLSPYNILDTKPESMVYRPAEEGSHRERLKVIDALQRYTLTRRPDIFRDHVYYGAMHSMKDLLAKKDILEKLPSPSSYTPKKKFGRIILVFKDNLKERTFFTKHDSLWENRKIPVLFEEARYLYEEINNERVALTDHDFNEKEKGVERPYVEANILGGVDLNDVEMIIAPEKQVNNREELIEQLLEKYQHIELLAI